MDKDGNISGEATVRPEVLAPMLGGRTKDGKMTLDIDAESNPVFLRIPKISSEDKESENYSLAKVMPYIASYNKLKEDILAEMTPESIHYFSGATPAAASSIGSGVFRPNLITGKTHNYIYNPANKKVYVLPLGVTSYNEKVGVTSYNEKDIPKEQQVSSDEFITKYLSDTPLNDSQNGQSLQALLEGSKKFGVDLTDEKSRNKAINISKTTKGKLYQELATALNNLSGEFNFNTEAAKSNLFLDDSGSPIGKGSIVLNAQDLAQVFPNYQKAVEEKIIKPNGFEKVTSDNGTTVNIPKYIIPIYKQTAADITNVTQSYVDAAYGSRKDVDDVRSKMIEQSKNSFDELNTKKGFIAFSKTLKDQKSIESYIQELNQNANDLASLDQNASLEAMNTLNDIYTLYKDKPADLKKQLFLFNLGLAAKKAKLQTGNPNPPELIMFNKASQALR